MQETILSFQAAHHHHEGQQPVPPPSAALVVFAAGALATMWDAGLRPYRAVLSADHTVGLLFRSGNRHAEVEFLAPDSLVMELVPHQPSYRS